MTRAVLGVDVGGTKTAAVLATLEGEVVEQRRAGGGNYQAIGLEPARVVYAQVVTPLLAAASRLGLSVEATAFGLCGLDRPVDEARLEGIIAPLVSPGTPTTLVNDTARILRAGTHDGVGVSVVSGTGSNCVGRGPDGSEARIGGFGHDFGDAGSAEDIGREGAQAAFRAADGRGQATALGALLVERYGLAHLYDLVDHFLVDAPGGQSSMGALAPLVFEAALEGDGVCTAILRHAGEELGHAAVVVGQQLFETLLVGRREQGSAQSQSLQSVDLVADGPQQFNQGVKLTTTLKHFVAQRMQNLAEYAQRRLVISFVMQPCS